MSGIGAFATYIPHERMPLEALRSELDVSDAALRRLRDEFGLDRIAVERSLRVHEMMGRAAETLLTARPDIAPRTGLILYTHTFSPFIPYLCDPLDGLRQRHHGLRHIPAMTAGQMNCASGELLLLLAARWLERHPTQEGVLLLVADKMYLPRTRYLRDSTVSADAAAAVFIDRRACAHRLLHTALRADASLYYSLESSADEYDWFQKTFAVGIVKTLKTALSASGLALQELRRIVPSNINRKLWTRVAQALQLPEETFYFPGLRTVGHAHNADVFINLEAACAEGQIKPGDHYATLTAGMGSTFGCSIIRY